MALVHPCPMCGRLVPYGSPYCDECAERRRAYFSSAEARSRARKRRGPAGAGSPDDPKYKRFYNSKAWRSLAAAVMSRRSWRCESCGRVASEVHHDPPIRTPEGWAHRLDPDHLHCLCTRCHNEAHGRFRGKADPGGGRKSPGAAGRTATGGLQRGKNR